MGGWVIKRIQTLMLDTVVDVLVVLSEAIRNHEKNLTGSGSAFYAKMGLRMQQAIYTNLPRQLCQSWLEPRTYYKCESCPQ